MKTADKIKSSIIKKRAIKGSMIVDELQLQEETSRADGGYFADVIEIDRNNKVIIYEIKSCLQDFRRDKKWQNYLQYCDLFYFVAPFEVIQKIKDELPKNVGLYNFGNSYHGYQISCERSSRKHGKKIDTKALKEKMNIACYYRLAKLHRERLL